MLTVHDVGMGLTRNRVEINHGLPDEPYVETLGVLHNSRPAGYVNKWDTFVIGTCLKRMK